jgi:hypothetical protein
MSLKINLKSLDTTPHRVATLLFMMQIPQPNFFATVIDVGAIVDLVVDVISGLLSMVLIWVGPHRSRSVKLILVRILLTLAVPDIMALHIIGYFPYSILDFVDVGCWGVIWWKRVGECSSGQSRGKVVLHRLL